MRLWPLVFIAASGAQAADLTIYTYDSFASEWGPGPKLEASFEAECACDIEFVPAGDGAAMLTRLRIEDEKSEADIALGLDQNLVAQAESTALFAEHGLGEMRIAGADITWDHPKFLAYDWGHFAFVYRKADVGDVPQNFRELGESDYRIVIEDPRASTPGLGLALWIYDVYGEEAEAVWAGMKDNIVTVTPGWSEAYALFLEGEADLVLSYSTSPAYHRIAEGDDGFAAAKFEEGHGLQIELAAVLKSSAHAERARAFLAFLQGEAAQADLMQGNWMYPVVALELPDGFDDPSTFKSIKGEASDARIELAIAAFEAGLR